jgi:tRNA pseudouridine55 synthase
MGRRGRDVPGPNGLLLVDKPAGISSAAVVARVRRVFGGVKAGHTGTLDPFATGLLPLALGEGTKLAAYLTEADKTYEGVIRLGTTTDTHDRTGTVTGSSPVPAFGDDLLEEVAAEFRGAIAQIPPSYSAIKKGGRPMYELARRGEAPELDPRPVRVDRLDLSRVGEDRVGIVVDCSKGFYVRSLARDIGDRLGCGALLESLRRTRVGSFRLEDALSLDAVEAPGGRGPALDAVLSLDEGLAHLRKVEIAAVDAEALRLGRQGPLLRIMPGEPGEKIRLAAGKELVAVAASEGRFWVLDRVFAAPPTDLAPCPAGAFVLPPAVSQMEEEERNEANRRD